MSNIILPSYIAIVFITTRPTALLTIAEPHLDYSVHATPVIVQLRARRQTDRQTDRNRDRDRQTDIDTESQTDTERTSPRWVIFMREL